MGTHYGKNLVDTWGNKHRGAAGGAITYATGSGGDTSRYAVHTFTTSGVLTARGVDRADVLVVAGGGGGGFGQAAGVEADADGDISFFGGQGDQAHFFRVTDITRIEAESVGSRLQGKQGELIIKMNISDQGNRDAFFNSGDGLSRFGIGHGDPHQIAVDFLKLFYLVDSRPDVTGVGTGH